VVEHKYLWVTADKEAMSFFQLFKGRLNLKKVVCEHDLLDSGDDRKGEWRTYGYALFPPSSSMERIEGYLDSHPILRWLSGEPLSRTEQPLLWKKSLSSPTGRIVGERRRLMNTKSWLSTDDVQFLLTLFLRNQDASTCFHILGPAIMHKVNIVYTTREKANKENRNNTEIEERTINANISDIKKYIDTRLDIMENKFLMFLCNVSSNHWISVVVVNAFVIFDKYLREGKDNCQQSNIPHVDDNFCGWCIMNSNDNNGNEQNGFQESVRTKNRASYGVRLFLNICASYLKAKNMDEGDGNSPGGFHYDEPPIRGL